MSHATWVLVNRARLPQPASLTKLAARAGWPLEVEAFDWSRHGGHLPMRWDGRDTGCEVALAGPGEEDLARAQAAGLTEIDAIVEVSHRDWDGLRAACAFIALVASAAKGAIDDGAEYVSSRSAKRWANQAIQSADEAQARERAREQALAALGPDLEGALDTAVARMSGAVVDKAQAILDRLMFRLQNGHSVYGAAWRLTSPSGRVLDQGSALAAAEELQRWPSRPVIARAERAGTTVRLEFENPEGGVVEFHGRDFHSEVSVRAGEVILALRGEEIVAR